MKTALPRAETSPPLQTAMLFGRVRSEAATALAIEELVTVAKSDRAVRAYLVANLPSLIEAGPHPPESNSPFPSPTWCNAATLAGELNIVEAVPALTKFFAERTSGPTETLSQESHLRPYPAALALVKIGDPAVSAIGQVLERGTDFERWRAAYALHLIGSSKAKAVLSQHAAHEPDQSLRDYISRATGQ